jgi:hypothetical protein
MRGEFAALISNRDHTALDISGDDSVCANLGISPDLNGTQDFCPGSDVDMA